MSLFSIVTSVYRNDEPLFVQMALDSILVNQTIKPNEVVLIRDGIVSAELELLLSEYENKYPDLMRVIRLDKNGGLGNALRIGVEQARYDVVARMDSDDICIPSRFERQIKYMDEHMDCDIVGGQITEFIGEPTNVIGKRVVSESNAEIYNKMRRRCEFNHVTVMFRKQAVLDAGNYQDWFWNEDYYLWVRMMLNNCTFANLPDVLVNVRSGESQYARRGGIKYFQSESGIQRIMLDNHLITGYRYLVNISKRFVVQILLPNSLRGWVFRTFARRKIKHC